MNLFRFASHTVSLQTAQVKKTAHEPPTLQDIANHLGLAKSSVSLALRDKGTLSTKTRKRIKDAAEAMGYRPDPLLAALVSRRTRSSADALPLAFISGKGAYGHHAFVQACSDQAEPRGYRIHDVVISDFSTLEARLRELWHRGTRGLILHHVDSGPWLNSDYLKDFAIVQCRLHHDPLPFTTVRSDIVRKTHTTVQRVLDLRAERVGMAVLLTSSDRSHPEDQDRIGGALSAQERYRKQAWFPKPLWVDLAQHSEQEWRDKARHWVTKHKLDTVICTSNGFADMLFSGWEACPPIACTLVVPQDGKKYNGMRDNTRLIGEKCMELIDQFIRSRQFGIPEHPYDVVIPSDWKEG